MGDDGDVVGIVICYVFFFQAEDGIRSLVRSRGVGNVYKGQGSAQRRGIEICGQIGWFHLENVDLPKESPGGRFCAGKFPRL